MYNIFNLLDLPNELLLRILPNLDLKSLIRFGIVSKKTSAIIVDPILWFDAIVKCKKYDTLSFCYDFSDNDTISYYKGHLDKYDIENDSYGLGIEECPCCTDKIFGADKNKQVKCFDYKAKVFNELWQLINKYEKKEIWLRLSEQNIDEKDLSPDLLKLINEINNRFIWSVDAPRLYKLLCSSLVGFYKVLTSGRLWQETCRTKLCNNSCNKNTPIYSIFCSQCRVSAHMSILLSHIIDSNHPHNEQRNEEHYTQRNEDEDDDDEEKEEEDIIYILRCQK